MSDLVGCPGACATWHAQESSDNMRANLSVGRTGHCLAKEPVRFLSSGARCPQTLSRRSTVRGLRGRGQVRINQTGRPGVPACKRLCPAHRSLTRLVKANCCKHCESVGGTIPLNERTGHGVCLTHQRRMCQCFLVHR